MAKSRAGGILDRRRFVLAAAGTVAGGATNLAWAGASASPPSRPGRPAPNPIPGGIELAPGFVIHVWGAGDPSVTLPFTGITLQGFDVEPSTITDFNGASALAYHVGTARASDGTTYNLETDIRAFEGDYVVDGDVHHGAFALI